jgi:hypothetical protein
MLITIGVSYAAAVGTLSTMSAGLNAGAIGNAVTACASVQCARAG